MSKRHVQTFYPNAHTEKIYTEIFPEQRLNFDDSGEAFVAVDFVMKEGQHYVVCFDRVNYELGVSGGVIANDLFSIFVEGEQMTVRVASAGTHTVRLTVCEEVVKKLDDKYMPNGLFGVEKTTVPGGVVAFDGDVTGVSVYLAPSSTGNWAGLIKLIDGVPKITSAEEEEVFFGTLEGAPVKRVVNLEKDQDVHEERESTIEIKEEFSGTGIGLGLYATFEGDTEEPFNGDPRQLVGLIVMMPGSFFESPDVEYPGVYLTEGVYLASRGDPYWPGGGHVARMHVYTSSLTLPDIAWEVPAGPVSKLDARCMPERLPFLSLMAGDGGECRIAVTPEGELKVFHGPFIYRH